MTSRAARIRRSAAISSAKAVSTASLPGLGQLHQDTTPVVGVIRLTSPRAASRSTRLVIVPEVTIVSFSS